MRRSVGQMIGYVVLSLGVLMFLYVLIAILTANQTIITPVTDYGGVKVLYVTPTQ